MAQIFDALKQMGSAVHDKRMELAEKVIIAARNNVEFLPDYQPMHDENEAYEVFVRNNWENLQALHSKLQKTTVDDFLQDAGQRDFISSVAESKLENFFTKSAKVTSIGADYSGAAIGLIGLVNKGLFAITKGRYGQKENDLQEYDAAIKGVAALYLIFNAGGIHSMKNPAIQDLLVIYAIKDYLPEHGGRLLGEAKSAADKYVGMPFKNYLTGNFGPQLDKLEEYGEMIMGLPRQGMVAAFNKAGAEIYDLVDDYMTRIAAKLPLIGKRVQSKLENTVSLVTDLADVGMGYFSHCASQALLYESMRFAFDDNSVKARLSGDTAL